ncbi:MAG: hypothetical protein ACKO58_00575 [Cyanobium sp.]
MIDAGRRSGRGVGRFLLLGSASVALIRQSCESLAGRIAFLELHGLNLLEIGSSAQDRLWIRGGFAGPGRRRRGARPSGGRRLLVAKAGFTAPRPGRSWIWCWSGHFSAAGQSR